MILFEKLEKLNSAIDAIPISITNYFKDNNHKVVFWVFFWFLILPILLIRYFSLSAINDDLTSFVLKWYDHLALNGGFSALGTSSESNYTPPYLYLIALATYIPWISKLFAIKIISIIFDFLLAAAIFKIVRSFTSSWGAWLSYLCVLFSPVVWVNSAYWGQCDAIYTSFLLFAIYYFLNKRSIPGLIFFSIALAFKLQAIFLVPFLLVYLLAVDHRWYLLIIIPIVYFFMSLPAVINGQPFINILTIYLNQVGSYHDLSLNAPSIFGSFNLVDELQHYEMIGYISIDIFICWLVLVALHQRGKLAKEPLVLIALISLLMTPFLLPRMHERYFYPAAIASIFLLFLIPRLWLAPVLINTSAFFSYFPWLWHSEPIPIYFLSILNLIAAVIMMTYLLRHFIFMNYKQKV